MTAAAVGMIFPGPYRIPLSAFSTKTMYTNTAGRAPYRGPWQFETLAREVTLDIAARRMGIDPAELRRRNMLSQDELPYKNPNGMTYDSITPVETFEATLQALDYDAFRTEQAQAREQGRYLGVGISSYVEPTTPGHGYYATEAATIRVEPSGKVNVYLGGGSSGNSLETTVVQLTADALRAEIDDITAIQGDTAVTGFGAGVAGSRSASMMAGAVRQTASLLREQITAAAAEKLDAAADEIELARSRVSVRGDASKSVSFGELAASAPSGLEAK